MTPKEPSPRHQLPLQWSELLVQLNTAIHYSARQQEDLVRRLERARRLMHECYGESLNLDIVAGAACLSRYHFARCFRRVYGEPPHSYLTRRRMERAKVALLESRSSIGQIALSVGFETQAAFSRAFAQYVGYSPTRHRRRLVQVNWSPPPAIPWCFQSAWTLQSA